jgi:CDP-paratose 2-epimerase
MKNILITGSAGLVGQEAVRFFAQRSFRVVGIDNDMRAYFFGPGASTKSVGRNLKSEFKDKYINFDVDIRDKVKLEEIFKKYPLELIIHAAAQPSHDWAVREPFTDFDINASATLNLLEFFRKYSPKATFIFTSTNKVYGDWPNKLPLVEQDSRWEVAKEHKFYEGIDESMSVDNCLHSLFGASKLSADILVQEYGKYFNLKTVSFRGGCLTGQLHQGAELHGFLAYLAKSIATGKQYNVYGYKGKQVRDNIHSYDLVNSFWHFYQNPGSESGVVYNIGGSRHSNISMKEAISYFEKAFKRKANIAYNEANRKGDHIWYISRVDKFKKNYPDWNYSYDIYKIMDEICRENKVFE